MNKDFTLLPSEMTRSRIETLLRGHWIKPTSAQPLQELSPREREEIIPKTLDVLLTRQFRVGPLPEPSIREELLARIRRFVSLGQPIQINLGYAPVKNQNAVNYNRVDWAEFFALGHLVAWHNKVQKVYPPGLRIQIVFDDAALRMANHTSGKQMKAYMKSVAALIHAMGYQDIFAPPFGQSRFAWLFYLGAYYVAWWRVCQWERRPEAAEKIEKMNQAAERNLILSQNLTPRQREQAIRQASHRYRIHWEAVQLVGITRSRKRLVAMYLDGNQHHIQQPVGLHLTTLDKGQVTQPWQGEGILVNNGHGKWEPGVMTANRRQKWHSVRMGKLNIIDMPGFDHILLAESSPVTKSEEPSASRLMEWPAKLAS